MAIGEVGLFSRGLFVLIFIATAIYGGFLCVRTLRRIRGPRPYADAVLTWFERPLSSYRFERANWLATAFPWAAVGLIGVLTILQLANPTRPVITVPQPSPAIFALIFAVAGGGSCAYIGLAWGLSTFQPIAQAIAGRAFFDMSNEGLLFSGYVFPWSGFDRFTYHPQDNVIRLWSAFSPKTISFTLSPLPPQSTDAILQGLRGRLRSGGASQLSFSLGGLALPATMGGISLLAILVSWGLCLALGWIGLIGNAVLLYAFLSLTARILFRFSSGGRHHLALFQKPTA